MNDDGAPGGYNHRPVVERLAPGSDPLADLVVYQQTLVKAWPTHPGLFVGGLG